MKSLVVAIGCVLIQAACATPSSPSRVDMGASAPRLNYRVVDDVGGGGGLCDPICVSAKLLIASASGDTLSGSCEAAPEWTFFECSPLGAGGLTGGTGRFAEVVFGNAEFRISDDGRVAALLNFAMPTLGNRAVLIEGTLHVVSTVIRTCSEGTGRIVMTGQLEHLGRVTVTLSFCVP